MVPLVVSVVPAYLGSVLTLRRVKRKRRWAARHDAYRSVLRALHALRFWAEDAYANANLLPAVGGTVRPRLRERFDDAKYHLCEHLHVGRLSLSPSAVSILQELLIRIAVEEPRFEEDRRGRGEYDQDTELSARKSMVNTPDSGER